MIDRIGNALQIIVLAVCAGMTIWRAVKTGSRTWALLAFVYTSWLMGDVYWLVCLVFSGMTPQISVVSDLSWYTFYIFLYLLLCHVDPPEECTYSGRLPWLGPVLTAGMAVYFMQWGEILSNLIYAALLGLLLYSCIRRLADKNGKANRRFLSLLVLIFCVFEYCLWLASCLFEGDTLGNPYYWFDFLLTVSFPLFYLAVRKAVTE